MLRVKKIFFRSLIDNSGDDMDISPDGSPKPSSGGQNRSRDVRPANTASSQNPPPGSGLPAPDQNIMWGQGVYLPSILQRVGIVL